MSLALDAGEAGLARTRGAAPRRGDRALAYGLPLLAIFSVGMLLLSVTIGASTASVLSLLASMLGDPASADSVMLLRDRIVITEVRMPRAALGFLVGAALAVSGAVMQGLFRNPLADPGIVGVSSGASLGAVTTIVFGATALAPLTAALGVFALPVMAFLGSLAVTFILYRLGRRDGETQIATMLIAGIAIAALAMALTGLLIYMADDRQLRDITFWLLGSLSGATWAKTATIAPVLVLGLAACLWIARGLDVLVLGEAEAFHSGVDV